LRWLDAGFRAGQKRTDENQRASCRPTINHVEAAEHSGQSRGATAAGEVAYDIFNENDLQYLVSGLALP